MVYITEFSGPWSKRKNELHENKAENEDLPPPDIVMDLMYSLLLLMSVTMYCLMAFLNCLSFSRPANA